MPDQKKVDIFGRDPNSAAGTIKKERENRQKSLCKAMGKSYNPATGTCSPTGETKGPGRGNSGGIQV